MIRGSIVAVVTPMRADGGLDDEALRRLLDYHIAQRSDGVVVVGTTGESSTLDMEEHCHVIRVAVKHVAGRIPVLAGTGSNSTAEAIELTQCAKDAGADACLLVTPYYNKPTQEGLYLHYKAVAETVAIPQILYNVPGRTGCDLLPTTVARLAQVENIVGIKDATADLNRVAQYQAECGAEFALYSGDDATALEFMLRGGHGVISVTANVAPAAMHQMCQHALAGEAEAARAIDQRLQGLHKNLFIQPNPIPVKWAVQILGFMEGGIRLPLTPLSEECQGAVREAMQQAGVI